MKRLPLITLSVLLVMCLVGTVLAEKPGLADGKKTTAVTKITPRTDKPETTNKTSSSQPTTTIFETTIPEWQSPDEPTAYDIPWMSINGGGGDVSSTNYRLMHSVGQSAIGYTSSTNYSAGIGYWYGVGGTTGCDCGDQLGTDPNAVGDINCDGNTDPLDVQFLVNFVFKSLDARCPKAACSYATGDVNCDSGVDPLDVQFLVNFVFKSLDALCDPC